MYVLNNLGYSHEIQDDLITLCYSVHCTFCYSVLHASLQLCSSCFITIISFFNPVRENNVLLLRFTTD